MLGNIRTRVQCMIDILAHIKCILIIKLITHAVCVNVQVVYSCAFAEKPATISGKSAVSKPFKTRVFRQHNLYVQHNNNNNYKHRTHLYCHLQLNKAVYLPYFDQPLQSQELCVEMVYNLIRCAIEILEMQRKLILFLQFALHAVC